MTTRILVIDDSPSERLYIGHFLAQHPEFEVTFASNGDEALRSLSGEQPGLSSDPSGLSADQPGLIVSDLRMPGMSGLEFMKQLKASGLNLPVILMTSFGSEQIAVQVLEAGAASYVPKKILETQLVSTIRSVMEVTRRRQERRRTLEGLSFSESHFVLGNDASSVAHVISHLLDTAVAMKLLSGQDQTRVGIALQEAILNAIHHGNLELDSELRQVDERVYYALADSRRCMAPYADRRVTIKARLSRHSLHFEITDEGDGFEPGKVPDPTAGLNLDRIGGRGLLLINSFMDAVSYNDRGNQITMIKYVSTPEQLHHRGDFSVESEVLEAAECAFA